MAFTKKRIAIAILFSIALLIFLILGIFLGLLFRTTPGFPSFSGGVNFPISPFLGFRGTYLIALADPTTEMNFLPNIATFTPPSPCEPGKQCTGSLRYNESQENPSTKS